MFPLISTLLELRQAKMVLREAMEVAAARGARRARWLILGNHVGILPRLGRMSSWGVQVLTTPDARALKKIV